MKANTVSFNFRSRTLRSHSKKKALSSATLSSLPLEVLTLTFDYLGTKDLKQCQLVNKLWRQASVKHIYSSVALRTEQNAFLYVRTISSSPQLGRYLKTIDINSLFQNKDNGIWDRYGLLNVIVKHCPNILYIIYDNTPDPAFWMKLTYAAKQGQLPRLQYFSCPYEGNLDSYIYTALTFKKTLVSLEALESDCNDRPNLLDSEAYSTLLNNLSSFSRLQNLTLCYKSGHRLSYYETIIEDCEHLETLSVSSDGRYIEEDTSKPRQSIHPRPNILTLECRWEMINTEEQLNYIMKKFPNLQTLIIECEDYSAKYIRGASLVVLMKFLRFAVNLQSSNIVTVLNKQECISVWANIMNEKYKKADINLNINISNYFTDNAKVLVASFSQSQLTLDLQSSSDDIELTFTKFLSKTGRKIQSLTLSNECYSWPEDNSNDIEIFDIDKVVQTIQLCPSLQNLTLNKINASALSNITYRHFELISLCLSRPYYKNSIDALRNISLVAPNLKQLELYCPPIKNDKFETITIDIPNISLDLLTLKYSTSIIRGDHSFEVYIRLDTDEGEKFYEAFERKLSPISAKQYYLSPTNACLDITCQNLSRLKIGSIFSAASIYTF